MPFEFRNRKLTSRFVAPYLRICIHGHLAHLRSTVPGIPDTHSLYSPRARYSRTSRPKEGLPGPQQALLLAGHASVNLSIVESCVHRGASKSLNQKLAGLLQPIIPSRPWSHLSVDFTTDLPPALTGHDLILVLVDSLSKMAHFIPAKKSFTAADTVNLLADRLIGYRGLPDVIISDRDPCFQSEL